MKLFFWIEGVCALILVGCALCFFALAIISKKEDKSSFKIRPSNSKTRFAILIPARNESRVINSNLKSISLSDYPKKNYDIYVIVEDNSDPTVQICQQYENTSVFYREDLNKQMKGYALDECIKSILKKDKSYDAFLILDADNVISKDFLSKMSDAYQAGYDAACGKRDNKDWNSSVVSSASALTFTIINTLQNKPKTERGMNVMFSGTGFFVKYDVLKELGGWPFASLTEDYEFSNYALISGLKTAYIEEAVYYDEQPNTLKQSIIQRTRWVRGYFQVRLKYCKDRKKYSKRIPKSKDMKAMKYGTLPALVLAFDIIFYLAAAITGTVIAVATHSGRAPLYFMRTVLVLGAVYALIALFTVFLFRIEKKEINITDKNKIKTIFYHPIFLSTYIVSALRSLYIKDTWEVIEHSSQKAPQNEEDVSL